MKKRIYIIAGALFMLTVVFVNVRVALGKNETQNISVFFTKSALAEDEGGEWWRSPEESNCFLYLGHCVIAAAFTVCPDVFVPWHCTPKECWTELSQEMIDACYQ